MRYSGFLTGCSNSWPEPKTFYHVQSRCRTSLSEMYLTTTPEPKEEPRVRVWEDCPSCFMCVKLHSLVSINVCTNSERKQLFCFIFFFIFFFARRTNGLIDRRADRLWTDEVATDDVYRHFLQSGGDRQLTTGSWERGMVRRPMVGVPIGRNPPPCLCMSLLCPGDAVSRISEWIHTSQRVLVILQWVISRGYFLMICIAAVLLRIYCIDV